MTISRRAFLGTAAATATAALAGGRRAFAQPAATTPAPLSLDGNRFLTFNTVVRVNQIEAGRDQLIGNDEAAQHTPEAARQYRETLAKAWPGGKTTWAFSWLALQDPRPNYKAIRDYVVDCHKTYGDDITFIPGAYFANMYNTRDQVNRDLHDGLALVSEMVGGGFRPQSVVAGFLSAENHRYLAENEGIHVCQGNIWSQYGVDNGDGEGSISYPYYPSKEHFCKPAQGPADFIDCVTLDGWTCDFVSARQIGCGEGFNSRMGVGPIETIMNLGVETGVRQMMATTAAHFDRGFERNKFGWITDCCELSLVTLRPGKDKEFLDGLHRWLDAVHTRWPEAKMPTQGAFGDAWRAAHKTNDGLDYRFQERGTGINGSDPNLEIRWFMNQAFRLALLKPVDSGPELVIDFTRYDQPAREPGGKGRNWSLINCINQKGLRPEDKPIPLAELPAEDKALIARHYPDLA